MNFNPKPRFVHLRLHTEFSVVDGIVRVDQAVAQAVEQGMPALAITDLSNWFGLIKFYKLARAKGVKPIVGCDVWFHNDAVPEQPFRALLLVRNHTGYLQLCELLTRAFLKNQIKGRACIRWSWLQEVGCDGLIALSGFAYGEIGQHLINGRPEKAQAASLKWQAVFSGGFFIELQRRGLPVEETLVQQSCKLAAQLQIPVVATHPIEFLKPEDFRAHEARVCIAEGEILSNPRRSKAFTQEQYFKSSALMHDLFADIPSALENTMRIAAACNLFLELGKPKLPVFPTPQGVSLDNYLVMLAKEGLQKRLLHLFPDEKQRSQQFPIYAERLKIETDTIIKMGFAGYFLIVQDFINWAKNNGVPVGPGRGSGAGSIAAYALGITDLDPIRYDLLFERFLNPERVSMPDFDIDFCQDNRDRVIDYVKQKYGRDAVSQIATFGTLGAKAVIRDAGRVLDIPYNYCDSLSKLIPHVPTDPWDLQRALKEEPSFRERVEKEDEAREIVRLAEPLEGLTRNVGMHAGGVLIAPGKLTDFCPLYCADGSTDSVVSQFDKDDVEAIGLVKFDFLGLRNLTILDWAVRWVRESYEDRRNFNLENLPLDDPAVYELFSQGNTTAVFQSESRSAKDLEKKLRPDTFEDIIALMALNRPGPLGSGMVDDFIARKKEQTRTGQGRAEWYFHEKLSQVLKSTYGVIVYQEQVMLVAQILAGYSLGGADLLRRAMGKKKPEEMAKQREIFTQGAVERGVAPQLATQLFDLMEKFAEYGFNKSHSAAYALVAYHTAWLKAHYPAEFMAATLSSDMDDTDKVKIFVEDCIEHCNLHILPPDINASDYRFLPVKYKTQQRAFSIRYGLGAIKGTGQAASEAIVRERTLNGQYTSLFDLVKRVDRRQINRRVLESLARSGAFDSLHADRARVLASVGIALEWAEVQSVNAAQASLFDGDEGGEMPPALALVPPWDDRKRLAEEKIALGFYLTGHVFLADAPKVRPFIKTNLGQLAPSRDFVWMTGVVGALRTQMTKRGKMAFLVLDDATATVEISVFNELYERHRAWLKEDTLVVIQGKVSEDAYSGGLRVVAEQICNLAQAREQFMQVIELQISEPVDCEVLQAQLQPYRAQQGGCLLEIVYQNATARCLLRLPEVWRLMPEDALFYVLKQAYGEQAVRCLYLNH